MPSDRYQNLETLRTALDEIETGIVLLDHDLRLQFINQAFLRMWQLDEPAIADLDFEGLMRAVVAKQSRRLTPAAFNKFVKERTMLVRAGIEDPRDVQIDGNKVVRVTCKALPDGGRMLIYSNVSDLVRYANELKELATIDSMTGLLNRRHFLWLAEIEWSRYQRYGRPMSLLMIDIDQFKAINDQFGHDAGDHVLIRIASICRDHKRKSDLVSRFGGDEFLILLPETTLDMAASAAERFRQQVAVCDESSGALPVGVTVSVGIAEANMEMHTIFDLLKLADQALYAAKRAGRDRVATS